MNVDNFVAFQKNRKQKVKRKSGGIAVMIKNNIYKHFEYVDTDCEYVLWFKLDKQYSRARKMFNLGQLCPTSIYRL